MNEVKLKTLQEFNDERLYEHSKHPFNGIECPNCKHELLDDDTGMVLLSSPPQIRIHCVECNYRGTRIE